MSLRALTLFRGQRASSKMRHNTPLELSPLEGRVLLSGAGDTTAPTTSVQLSGNGENGYYTTPVTLNFTANDPDDASDTLATYYSINGGGIQARNSATLTADGTYNVDYWSVDPAGNREMTERQGVRIDRTPPSISEFADPNVLWPPNHKLVPVTVTGHVTDNLSGINSTVTYQVADEYHQDQPSGSTTVDSQGNYRFVVDLQSSRLGQDKNGRQYVISVTAHDLAGNSATASLGVLVPHDMGHGFRGGLSGPIAVGPQHPNFAEIRRERLAAREHAVQVRRAAVEARREHRLAVQHAEQLQHRNARQADAHNRANHAARNVSQIRFRVAHPLIALPSAIHHGNGPGNQGDHGNSHGNQGDHGNHGNGHGKK